MRKNASRPRLPKQPLAQPLAFRFIVDIANTNGFDRDRTPDRGIDGVINHAHGASAEFAHNAIPADALHVFRLA